MLGRLRRKWKRRLRALRSLKWRAGGQGLRFETSGVRIELPEHMRRNRGIHGLLQRGHYEKQEAAALSQNLLPEDRLLELGAGLGFISCKAAQTIPAGNITLVEANPKLIPVIHRTLELNGCTEATVLHGAVSAGPGREAGAFYVGPNFMAASLAKEGRGNFTEVSVPVLDFSEVLGRARPTVIIMDVEGSELDLLAVPLPDYVRLVIMEIHRGWLGDAGIQALFERLHAQGFVYWAKGSTGAILCFARAET